MYCLSSSPIRLLRASKWQLLSDFRRARSPCNSCQSRTKPITMQYSHKRLERLFHLFWSIRTKPRLASRFKLSTNTSSEPEIRDMVKVNFRTGSSSDNVCWVDAKVSTKRPSHITLQIENRSTVSISYFPSELLWTYLFYSRTTPLRIFSRHFLDHWPQSAKSGTVDDSKIA